MLKDIIIGKPIVHPAYIFCEDEKNMVEWENTKADILFTDERFLPKIMVELGIVKSISEVRRNKKELVVTLDKLDYMEIKWGKHRLFIIVGE